MKNPKQVNGPFKNIFWSIADHQTNVKTTAPTKKKLESYDSGDLLIQHCNEL